MIRSHTIWLQGREGFDQPLLRYQYEMRHTNRAVALLDIMGAYPSVLQGKLIEVLKAHIPTNLASIMAVILVSDKTCTVGAKSTSKRNCEEKSLRDPR